jgi:DNA-binding transcriptional ArsR family regulator
MKKAISPSSLGFIDTTDPISPSKIFFETLANEKRFAIIHYLKDRSATMSDIVEELNIEQSITSRHLRRLEHCGFVTAERRGRERIYTLNEETIKPLMRLVERHIERYCAQQCCADSGQCSHYQK